MIMAWFNEPELKEAVMQQLRQHKRLDEIVQGSYWRHGKGCHLGCLTHTNNTIGSPHAAMERLFGIPNKIPWWLEAVFEGLPIEQAKRWVIESTDAIPVGANLSLAHHSLGVWLFDPQTGINTIDDTNRDAIDLVRSLHCRALNGEVITKFEWSAAKLMARSVAGESVTESAARSAAGAAAGAAMRSATNSAAESVAGSVKWSVRSAKWLASVNWSARSEKWLAAVNWSARSEAWKQIAAKSIEIFRNAPIEECELCSELLSDLLAYINRSKAGLMLQR